MKIQCDVCHKDEASLFCVADEAALCQSCDHTIHHANNKLVSDHHRLSLLQPSPKQSPLCDICQERRAFLFCQQDRAILCRGCDVGIHKANEHTQKHNRFLLTGVKISATSALNSSSSPSSSSSSSPNCLTNPQKPTNIKPVVIPLPLELSPIIHHNPISNTSSDDNKGGGNGQLMMTSSSISEYLEMLPGYHVEELLDSSYGFYKIGDNDVLPFWGSDDLESHFSSEITKAQNFPSATTAFAGQIGFKNSMEAANKKTGRKWRDDNSFAVPQISTFKKSRTLC